MQTSTHRGKEAGESALSPTVLSLERETRAAVDTETAAFHLNRRPQTLRAWACLGTYPEGLRPVRISGRLAWPVAGIRKALGVPA